MTSPRTGRSYKRPPLRRLQSLWIVFHARIKTDR